MRCFFAVSIVLTAAVAVGAQEVPPRFDLRYNPELYKQDTPQDTLKSILGALSRDRYDYLAGHLLDPRFVDGRMAANQPYYDRVAGERISSTASGKVLRGEELQARVREVSTQLNFQQLTDQIRAKLADEPTNLRDLKQLAREGDLSESGDSATVSHKTFKDRSLFFKKVEGRWYLENRQAENAVTKE